MVACVLIGLAGTPALPQENGARATPAVVTPLSRVSVGSVPAAVARATPLARLEATTPVAATLTLPLRDPTGLREFLARVSDPSDPLHGRYLTPAQFTNHFGPTQADYDAVAVFARSSGLTVTGVHANRLLLDVSGPAPALEAAFGVHLYRYRAPDGRLFRAPDAAPSLPRALAGRVSGIVGLSDAAIRRSYKARRSDLAPRAAVGTGPKGGLAPGDIRAAYGLGGVTLRGDGQTLAVFELDGYNPADVQSYEGYFGLTNVPLQNVLIDGATGAAGADADEVTLDIELQAVLAPGASRILVYETANTDSGTLDGYSRIAEDDLALQVSTSWGLDEPDNTTSFLQSEDAIFQQMAAQGQTVYASAGDSGAYDTGSRRDGLTVDDPASQPAVCGVGGTSLTTGAPGGPYQSETTWNAGSPAAGAGGGGVSGVWPLPAWQQGVVTAASGGSTAMRNVPDVSLNADPNKGYAIYVGGAWSVYGGTSCAAPLWAGFTALVNQQRAAAGSSPLGQAAPALYPILGGAGYASAFHDIADGSTNLYYRAVTGYDDATGLGTFSGAALLAALTPSKAASLSVGVDGYSRLLWDNADGTAAVWLLDPAGRYVSQQNYGPFAGWAARAVSTGPDLKTRALWVNGNTAAFWRLDANNGYLDQQDYGPFTGWTAISLSTGPDGYTRVLWNNVNGTAAFWLLDPDNRLVSQTQYGPFAGWMAKSVSTGPDLRTRVLWTNGGGQAAFWRLDANNNYTDQQHYGPFTGYTAVSLSVGADGYARAVWAGASGASAFWLLDPANTYVSQTQYGPFVGWSAQALTGGAPDASSRALWANVSGQIALWDVDPNNHYLSQQQYGPF